MRKQVYDLTLNDLAKWPAWEFALDEEGVEGQDEATVRPIESEPPFNPADGMCVVAARFVLADGTRADGYLSPQPVGDENKSWWHLHPGIITPEGQVGFWFGAMVPDAKRIGETYRKLGRSAEQVFPIKFESAVLLTVGQVKGEIPGFQHFERSSWERGERDIATVT